MSQEADPLDPVWRALASPIRRRILDILREGPRITGDLADEFSDLSRFAVMQHLGVLEEADLVIRKKDGRTTWNHMNPVPIQRLADRWIDRMRRPWVESLVDLKSQLESEVEAETEDPPVDEAAEGGA